jgi:imidazole glycerol phosphate synthase subunit HisF
MFSKRIEVFGDGHVVFAINDEGERTGQDIDGVFHTEKDCMIMAVAAGGGDERQEVFSRLSRAEVVQLARFFAEAASKMD